MSANFPLHRIRNPHFSNTRRERSTIHCFRGFPRGRINRVFLPDEKSSYGFVQQPCSRKHAGREHIN
jgi:hypothetical protein